MKFTGTGSITIRVLEQIQYNARVDTRKVERQWMPHFGISQSYDSGISPLIDGSGNFYAVFQRPLPMIRLGDVFWDALNGVAPLTPSLSAPASATSSVQGKVAVGKVIAETNQHQCR